jgi:hypothetical protein
MLTDLVAQLFCRELARKLRRLGVLGALVGAYFALHVELPLEISIATKEARAAAVDLQRSIGRTLTRLERHSLEMHHLKSAERSS